MLQNYSNSWFCLDGPGESNGTEAFRTQGRARLRIEGQSLWRTRLLPKSQPRGAGALIHSFLEKSEPEPARIGDLTYSAQQRGHLQKYIPKARLGGRVKVFVAFFLPSVFAAPPHLSSRSCEAMAAAFQHFGAWTAPICNPSALHPSGPLFFAASAVHPPPPRARSACAPLYHQHPHLHHPHHDLHHHQRLNYSQHNCVLSLRGSPRSAG